MHIYICVYIYIYIYKPRKYFQLLSHTIFGGAFCHISLDPFAVGRCVVSNLYMWRGSNAPPGAENVVSTPKNLREAQDKRAIWELRIYIYIYIYICVWRGSNAPPGAENAVRTPKNLREANEKRALWELKKQTRYVKREQCATWCRECCMKSTKPHV